MSQATTALAAAAALGAASEATGTTAFTPLGQQAREQQGGGGGGRPPAFPSPGGVSEDVLGQLAESFRQQQAGTSVDLSLGGLGQQAGADAGTIVALEELRRRLEDQQERTRDWRERFEERVEETTDGDGDGGLTLPDWLQEPPGEADIPDGLTPGDGGGESFLDKTERAGGQLKEAGGTAKDSGRFLGDVATEGGQTIWEASKLLATGEADTSGTWSKDRGRITLGGAHPSEWSLPGSDRPSSKKDDPEVFGLGGGVDAIDPLGNFRDDSSSESEEPVVSLPDELQERLDRPTDLPAGGL